MASAARSPRRPVPSTWIQRYLALQERYDARIDKLLEQAAKDIESQIKAIADKPGIGAEVRRTQLIGARGAVTKALAEFWIRVGNTVRAGRAEAKAEALLMSFDWDETLLARAFPNSQDRAQMRSYLVSNTDKNVEAMLRRVFQTKIPLSKQVYRSSLLSKGWVDRAINAGLASGASAEEIAKSVSKMISPSTPGGVTYAARRLGRTELNTVYHAQSIEANSDKPWNTGMKWNVSKSHPVPDLCDVYARHDESLGRGVFSLESVPDKPHPQCFCYATPETISVEEFNKKLLAGEFDGYLESTYGVK